MAMCQLMLHVDAAFDCVSELGELGMVQFKDLNSDALHFRKKYVSEIRRCEKLERNLSFLMHEMKQRDIEIYEEPLEPSAASQKVIGEIEARVEHLEKEVKMVTDNLDLLTKNFMNLNQMKHLMKKTQTFFDQVEGYGLPDLVLNEDHSRRRLWTKESRSSEALLNVRESDASSPFEPISISNILHGRVVAEIGSGHSFRLRIVSGVVASERVNVFEKMLFRVSRGNVYMKTSNIEVPITSWNNKTRVQKTVFIIFLQGDQLMQKVLKVCEGFHADLYTCPEGSTGRRLMAMEVMTRLEELNIVIKQTQDHLFMLLKEAARYLHLWSVSIMKAKAIYHTLNHMMYDSTAKMLIGEGWHPISELDNIRAALKTGTFKSGMSESSAILHRCTTTSKDMPTYHKTNKITSCYQKIIDAYGVSNYMEINPAVFSIITFPFLFSIMFGDIGHGILYCCFAAFLIIRENKFSPQTVKGEVFGMVFGSRYLLLLMGLFSIYSGFMYNDIFSRQVRVTESKWDMKNVTPFDHDDVLYAYFGDSLSGLTITLEPDEPAQFNRAPCAFGMDPVWQMSHNKVKWLNSYKMKLSIIMGVAHMLFGITLNFVNQRCKRNWLNVFCEVVPQIIFLLCTFGYLVALIIHKWIYYTAKESAIAPSILIGFINMFLMSYPSEPEHIRVSDQKKNLQIFLLMCALLCVPWMLLVKPYIIWKRRKARSRPNYNNSSILYRVLPSEYQSGEDVKLLIGSNSDEEDDNNQFNVSASPESEEDEEPFSDIVVTQCIHTIEFCLGCISHTASYLRLWALSLAHGQLSEVIWGPLIGRSLKLHRPHVLLGGLHIASTFLIWAFLTAMILLCMEGLSAFLHTLRLHWIEFMSKFYGGEGRAFQPFTLSKIQLSLLEEVRDFK